MRSIIIIILIVLLIGLFFLFVYDTGLTYGENKEKIFSEVKVWFAKERLVFEQEFQKEINEMKESFKQIFKDISIKNIFQDTLLKSFNYLKELISQ